MMVSGHPPGHHHPMHGHSSSPQPQMSVAPHGTLDAGHACHSRVWVWQILSGGYFWPDLDKFGKQAAALWQWHSGETLSGLESDEQSVSFKPGITNSDRNSILGSNIASIFSTFIVTELTGMVPPWGLSAGFSHPESVQNFLPSHIWPGVTHSLIPTQPGHCEGERDMTNNHNTDITWTLARERFTLPSYHDITSSPVSKCCTLLVSLEVVKLISNISNSKPWSGWSRSPDYSVPTKHSLPLFT